VYQSYDGYGRVTQIHHKDTSSGNSLAKLVYGYDKSHQVTSQDKFFYDGSNNRITTDTVDEGDQYDYDGAKRLVTVLRGVPTAYINDTIASNISNTRYDDLVEYVLDQTGNRLTRKIDGSNDKTYAYNVVNEMTTEAGTGLSYYDNGTYKGPGATNFKYTWDDHLAWWKKSDTLSYTWRYDALGRQVARVKSGILGSTDIRIYYDGVEDVETVTWSSSTETQTRRSVYGESIDELLETTDYDSDPDVDYYAHADKLGSIVLLADNAGTNQESYRYTDFGQTTVVDGSFAKLTTLGSNINNWKRYTGRERALPATFGDDWYFYRARVYRADAGRFVQRDPVHIDGPNPYVYSRAAPLNFVDPMGMTTMGTGGAMEYCNSPLPTPEMTTEQKLKALFNSCVCTCAMMNQSAGDCHDEGMQVQTDEYDKLTKACDRKHKSKSFWETLGYDPEYTTCLANAAVSAAQAGGVAIVDCCKAHCQPILNGSPP